MPPLRERPSWTAGQWIAAGLAVAVHLAFIVFLIVGVTWQTRHEEPVSVDLYAPVAVAPAIKEAPKPEPQPEPEPKPEPEPPKPVVAPQPPAPSRADILLKEKQDRDRIKAEAELARKEKERVDAERKKAEDKRLADAQARQQQEQDALKAQAEREQTVAAQAAAAARSKATDNYMRRIQAKIRGNVVVPPDMAGNPEAIFDVVQLPTGEIIVATLRKSSGVRAYDEAVQRAIIKSSPLPLPESMDTFQRGLTLKFRPLD